MSQALLSPTIVRASGSRDVGGFVVGWLRHETASITLRARTSFGTKRPDVAPTITLQLGEDVLVDLGAVWRHTTLTQALAPGLDLSHALLCWTFANPLGIRDGYWVLNVAVV